MASKNYLKYRKNFPQDNAFKGISGAPQSEFSNYFAQGMADRMAVSYHKYGLVAEAYPEKVDAIESLKARLKLYAEGGEVKGQGVAPGNTEYLMDAANFAMIEFMHPKHPNAFFKATDSNGSPGRAWNDGSVSDSNNRLQSQKRLAEKDSFIEWGSEREG
jgi:hypothetical protein